MFGKRKKLALTIIIVLAIGFLIPQNLKMPVKGAVKSDYNSKSFWYYPWGKSVTHKGVDIFAKKGTTINSGTAGFVLYAGNISMAGNFVVIIGPKWRLHFYAHLNKLETTSFNFVSSKSVLGTVGNTGNAEGKPAHLHYSIVSVIPYLWRVDSDIQGWKKMFYLNPIEYLEKE